MRMNLAQAAQAMHAEIIGLPMEREFSGAAMDSRCIRPGDVFFCLPGTRTDGHDFAGQAVQAGAAAIVAERRLPDIDDQVPVLLVKNTISALGELAHAWREQTGAKVVGVTGSAGKTTVKEMLAHVCGLAGETCKNHLNWNNQIGLPMSLLSCSGQELFWVMEAGISRPGDMEELARILAPDVAVVVNVGPAHLQALGTVQGVAQAKATLLTYLRAGGAALVNQDCKELWDAARRIMPGVHGFSTHDAKAEFFGRRILDNGSGSVRMELVLRGRGMELHWPRSEAPLLENVLAVAGTATLLGIDGALISQGLLETCAPQSRFQVRNFGRWLLIDDTYNANPLSMAAALSRARELAGTQPLVCVLSDMLELGAEASKAHRELGQELARAGCMAVMFHGSHAQDVFSGLHEASWNGYFRALESPQTLCDLWRSLPSDQGVVLFKGSRGGAMETFLEALCAETAT